MSFFSVKDNRNILNFIHGLIFDDKISINYKKFVAQIFKILISSNDK